MNNKRFLKIVFGLSILIIFLISGLNYVVDPLWLFNHSNKLNQKQGSFDERQLKTNHLYYNLKDNFEGILLGSSRATYINQNDFVNMNIFNYSSGAMMPSEYKTFIDFAKKIRGKDLKYIIIASDFFGTNKAGGQNKIHSGHYIDNALNTNRYKFLISFDTLRKSIANVRYSFLGRSLYYDRETVKHHDKIPIDKLLPKFYSSLKASTSLFSDPHYMYNDEYIDILKSIKKENPNSKFIVFTSAISSDLLVSKIKNADRWEDYKRWLIELTEVFGEVYNFMTINTITKDIENYYDDNHLYPSALKLLAGKLSYADNGDIPKDFGVLLTKDNIEKHLESLKKQIEEYELKIIISSGNPL